MTDTSDRDKSGKAGVNGVAGPPALRALGLAICKLDAIGKKPTYPGWPTRSLEADDFAAGDRNGILGGPLSDGNKPGHALVPTDLDDEAAIKAADGFLPSTGMEEGRPGKPRDHRYYLVPLDSIPEWAWSKAAQASAAATVRFGHPGPWKKQFRHNETDKCLIDFIGTGGQVECPSAANERRWVGGEPGRPAVVPFPELWDAVCRLAEACGWKNAKGPSASAGKGAKTKSKPTDEQIVKRAIAYLDKCDPAVSGQGGHDTCYWPARVLCLGFDLGEDRGFDLLLQHYNHRSSPPWTERELRHKCHDADTLPFGKARGWLLEDTLRESVKAAAAGEPPDGGEPPSGGEPRDAWEEPIPLTILPPVADFPTEVFPQALEQFAVQSAVAIGCPVDYPGVAMLAIAGGAMGATKAIAIKRGYVQRALLYATIVGPPGDGKSPALILVSAPLHEAQQRALVLHEQAREVYEEECRKAKADKKENPPKPVLPRHHVDDATVESLAPILQKNPRGVIMIRDEAAAWVTSANQYKGGQGSDRQFWLANWAGMQACIDRKGKEDPLILPHPFVAVVGGIQPEVLDVLGDPRGRSDGSIDRILFGFPEARPAPEWSWDEISDEIMAPWRQTVQGLLALNMEPGAHGLRPLLVALTPEAKPRFKILMNSLVDEINHPDFPPRLRGPWMKLKVYAARLALIIHFIRFVGMEADTQDVDDESIRRAALLITYFKSHARKVLAAMGADPKTAAAKHVLACLRRNSDLDNFTRADLFRLVRGTFPEPAEVDAPLNVLTTHHYLRCHTPERPAGSRGANPPRYLVNPRWQRTPEEEPEDAKNPDEDSL